jgi:hypothetical protein
MMRNIRIQTAARLNPSCAIGPEFESMLRTTFPQNLFPQPVLMFAVKSSDAVSRLRRWPNGNRKHQTLTAGGRD